jgi:hypothetical protein
MFSQCDCFSISVTEMTSGIVSFQKVSPSIHLASMPTPLRLIHAKTTSMREAQPIPAGLRICPCPPSMVSHGNLLARYSIIASTSIVGIET